MSHPTVRQFQNAYAIRVKRTPILRTYGVRCRSWEPMNCRAWPGEVGTLDYRVLEGNGWHQVTQEASFPGGRRVTVLCGPLVTGPAPDGQAVVPPTEFASGFDPLDFVLVRKAPTPEMTSV